MVARLRADARFIKIAMSRGIQIISVIGGREPTPKEQALALEVGRELAVNNIIVACGGLGGVMEAACKGAKEKEEPLSVFFLALRLPKPIAL